MSKGSKIKKQNSKSEKDSFSLGSDFSVVDGKSTCDKGMPVGAESNELLDTEAKARAEESLIIKSTSLNARLILKNGASCDLDTCVTNGKTSIADAMQQKNDSVSGEFSDISVNTESKDIIENINFSHSENCTNENLSEGLNVFCGMAENGDNVVETSFKRDKGLNKIDSAAQNDDSDGVNEETVVENHKSVKTKKAELKKKKEKKRNLWWLKITIISFLLAAFFSFISDLTSSFGNIIVIVLLLVFLILGSILFDGIGVAVTSCELAPLVAMSARNVYGARTAIKLVKNAEKVANICNDVIGDIFGIVSGGCSIVIVLKLMTIFTDASQQLITIIISSIVGALTIGGKAMLKESAIKNSKDFVMFVSKILAIFSKEERRIRKKHK